MARAYISAALDRKIRTTASNRCGYCLSPQHLTMARLEIEHIIPLAKGGGNDEANHKLACPICNRYKGDQITAIDPITGEQVSLFNPRTQGWFQHFRWSEHGVQILGLLQWAELQWLRCI